VPNVACKYHVISKDVIDVIDAIDSVLDDTLQHAHTPHALKYCRMRSSMFMSYQ
jgi:hypothetical protein